MPSEGFDVLRRNAAKVARVLNLRMQSTLDLACGLLTESFRELR